MENSRKSKSSLPERVADSLCQLVPAQCSVKLGLSGGVDSVVLLHLLCSLAPRYSWQISALHVHHGISPNADAWAEFCAGLCANYKVPLLIEYVDISQLRNEHGIEAAARKLRHAAFAQQDCDFIALAHHADDQVETLLLQLLRGAGIKGVAAMPLLKPGTSQTAATLRPLLDVHRSELLKYAQQHHLKWVEDESNADDYYPRNFLRNQLLPMLEEKFPAYRDTLSRSARHFAEAGELLDELAQQDTNDWTSGAPLEIASLRALSLTRAKNLLRYFLHVSGAPMPQTLQLDDMLHQLLTVREDSAVCVEFGGWQVRYYQNKVYVLREPGDFDPTLKLDWLGEAELLWPASNTNLIFLQTLGQGVSLKKLQQARVTLRLRSGGESLRPHAEAATRSLKNLLQEYRIPPWLRERLPLLYCGEELVSVIGVAIAAEYQAEFGEASLVVADKHLVYDDAHNKL
jgi:tRNA(Ile)-lysidine synthase